MQVLDYLIKNAKIFKQNETKDIGISNGKISIIKEKLENEATNVIDANNMLLAPSFVDSHTHLDKALSSKELNANGLLDAINQATEFQRSLSLNEVKNNVKERASKVIEWEAENGSCAIKSHVLADDIWKMEALFALNELKEEFKEKIDVINITPYNPAIDKEWRDAAQNHQIDFIAGYPWLQGGDGYANETDLLFELAIKYDLPLDLHVNESDAADVRCFEYVLKKTIETGLGNRVTCGHVTALNAVDDKKASELIELAAKAKINIITLPSCNMYLMGRNDKQPIRRGLTRVKEFLDAGVNISFASDNIRDPFRPFGNGNMLEEALFTAQCIQFGTGNQLDTVFEMGTYNPAKNCLLDNYGIYEGSNASFNIFYEESAAMAIISQKPLAYVFHNGKLTYKN